MKSKKISLWTALLLMFLTAVITFQMTAVLGDRLFSADAEEAAAEPTEADRILMAIEKKLYPIVTMYSGLYVGDLPDAETLAEGAAAGFVAVTGDKYGVYHTSEEYQSLMEGYSGEFAGIGVSVLYNAEYGYIEVMNVMRNSPAMEAGIFPNDLIIGVDGVDAAELGYNETVNRIRGVEGTTVVLTIARGKETKTVFDVTVERRVVEEESVTYEPLFTDSYLLPVAYISITDFNDKTASQFAAAISEARAANAHGYIFDLRNNGGGELSAVLSMLDLLLPEGPIVRILYKGGRERVYDSGTSCLPGMFTVLVNEHTASASELFTSSLRDYKKALVVGKNTYGKGTVQTIYPLAVGGALRISVAMYNPPYSDNFEGIGLKPDIEADLPEEYRNVNLLRIPHEEDTQLQAALDLYR